MKLLIKGLLCGCLLAVTSVVFCPPKPKSGSVKKDSANPFAGGGSAVGGGEGVVDVAAPADRFEPFFYLSEDARKVYKTKAITKFQSDDLGRTPLAKALSIKKTLAAFYMFIHLVSGVLRSSSDDREMEILSAKYKKVMSDLCFFNDIKSTDLRNVNSLASRVVDLMDFLAGCKASTFLSQEIKGQLEVFCESPVMIFLGITDKPYEAVAKDVLTHLNGFVAANLGSLLMDIRKSTSLAPTPALNKRERRKEEAARREKETWAALSIQKTSRRMLAQKALKRLRAERLNLLRENSATRIQACARGMFAKTILRNLKAEQAALPLYGIIDSVSKRLSHRFEEVRFHSSSASTDLRLMGYFQDACSRYSCAFERADDAEQMTLLYEIIRWLFLDHSPEYTAERIKILNEQFVGKLSRDLTLEDLIAVGHLFKIHEPESAGVASFLQYFDKKY